ncbi:50S ribosomal protein L23 [Planctomycetota bacterium]
MVREPYTIIKRPVVTEKTTDAATDCNAYAFEVLLDANKIEIRKAIEKIYKVKVKKVRTQRVRGKWKRVGRSYGRTPQWKKAIVSLQEGESIDLI